MKENTDMLVARALVWTDIITVEFAGGVQAQGVKPDTVKSIHTGYAPKHVIPKYSTDISAAWELVDKLKEDYCLALTYENSRWECYLEDEDQIISHVSKYALAAPEAICLAFLETKGQALL